jgi:hypothetical protein
MDVLKHGSGSEAVFVLFVRISQGIFLFSANCGGFRLIFRVQKAEEIFLFHCFIVRF